MLCGLLVALQAIPLSGQWSQDDFRTTSWGVAEGLPGNHVSALAQDEDGFLWLATMAGLVRFDGVEFMVFNETEQGLPFTRVTALDAGPSGRLWIGSELGHVSVRERDSFRLVAEPRYPGQAVSWVVEDANRDAWVLHASGWRAGTSGWLWHWTEEEFRSRTDLEDRLSAAPPGPELEPSRNPGGSASQHPVLVRDSEQRVWAVQRGGARLRLDEPDSRPQAPIEPGPHMLGANDLAARALDDRFELIAPDGSLVARLPRDPARLRAVWLRDQRGLVWVSTVDGVEVHDERAPDPLARWDLESHVLDLIEDREGNIWIATRLRGIVRIQTSAVRQIGPEQGVPLPSKLHADADGSAVMSAQLMQPDGDPAASEWSYRLRPDHAVPVVEGRFWEQRDSHGTTWYFGGSDLQGVRADASPGAPCRPTAPGPTGSRHLVGQ